MSGSLGGGRRQQREQVKEITIPMQQDMLDVGMKYATPPAQDAADILKLLEQYWKAKL